MKKKKTYIFDLDLQKEVHCDWRHNTPILRHAVIEGGGIAVHKLEHNQLITELEKFCKKLGLHIVQKLNHQFLPQGKSIVFVLSESHLAVHTWPEKGYIHIDLVTCGKKETRSLKFITEFKTIFSPAYVRLLKLRY